MDGLRSALQGQKLAATEVGDELGLALRGYVPVLKDGISGPIVGAVMIADPLDQRFLSRLGGGEPPVVQMRVVDGPAPGDEPCMIGPNAVAHCSLTLTGAGGGVLDQHLAFDVPLADLARAQAEAQRGLWLASAVVLALGAIAAWFLAGSLVGPLAQLTEAAQRIADGDLERPVTVRTNDEIGTLAVAFEQMRGRVASATGTLRDERDVLDAVLESAGDGILMVDEVGRTVVSNYALDIPDRWRRARRGGRAAPRRRGRRDRHVRGRRPALARRSGVRRRLGLRALRALSTLPRVLGAGPPSRRRRSSAASSSCAKSRARPRPNACARR